MVNNKTGGLFRLAVKLMQAESKLTANFVPIVNLIGILFQIRDDYMNLQSPTYSMNKGYYEDLTEGKFSFPIVHAIRSDRSSNQLMNILKQRTQDRDVKNYAVNYMRDQTRSFEYCKRVIRKLEVSVRAEIARLGGNKPLEKIVDKMTMTTAAP